jgi:hypothetical protein
MEPGALSVEGDVRVKPCSEAGFQPHLIGTYTFSSTKKHLLNKRNEMHTIPGREVTRLEER